MTNDLIAKVEALKKGITNGGARNAIDKCLALIREEESNVDLEALFRAFVKSIESTANSALAPYHAPGTIQIPEEEIQYWLGFLPTGYRTHPAKQPDDEVFVDEKTITRLIYDALDTYRTTYANTENVYDAIKPYLRAPIQLDDDAIARVARALEQWTKQWVDKPDITPKYSDAAKAALAALGQNEG